MVVGDAINLGKIDPAKLAEKAKSRLESLLASLK
jgi:hypothetical protein